MIFLSRSLILLALFLSSRNGSAEHPARGSPLGTNKMGRRTWVDSAADATATKSPTGMRSPKVERRTTMSAEREVNATNLGFQFGSFHLEIHLKIGFSGLSFGSSTSVSVH